MSSLAIAGMLFGCVLISTLVAMLIARQLPDHHLSSESREVVKLGLGVIGTLTAMVLGLLVAATKGTYDAQSGSVKEIAAQLAVIDRILDRYGADADAAQNQLRQLVHSLLGEMWPEDLAATVSLRGGESRNVGEAFFESISSLQPQNDSQRMLKSRALEMSVGLASLRQRLVVNSERTIPAAMLVALGVWQGVLFAGFGLLASRNATTIVVLAICMLSVSGAIFLVMELDRPFAGIIRVSDAPLRSVLSHLGD